MAADNERPRSGSPQLLVVVAALGLLILAVAARLPPWRPPELPRVAGDVHTLLQLARVEAVSRKSDCRLIVDPAARTVEVLHTRNTEDTADDEQLYFTTLPRTVRFERPDAGDAISFSRIGPSSGYQVIFRPNGSVSGAGEIVLAAKDDHRRLIVAADGHILAQRWHGSSWKPAT